MTAPPILFRLDWCDDVDGQAAVTVARVRLLVAGRAIWPSDNEPDVALEVFADDLLSHLTRFWKPLMLRQTYPLPLKHLPERPSWLRAFAQRQWADLPEDEVEQEDERVTAFEKAHDLSRAFGGFYDLPHLFFMRDRNNMLVETPWGLDAVPFLSARAALEAVGEQIAERLNRDDPDRWQRIVEAWRAREGGKPESLLAWATSLSQDSAHALLRVRALKAPTTVTEAANDDDELRIAARMSSALPLEEVREVIGLVKKFKRHGAERLDEFSHAALKHIADEFSEHAPFDQGTAAASFLRKELELASVQRVDVFGVLRWLGAEVDVRSDGPETLHGLAVWGPNHGPAVLINNTNASGRNVEMTWFARVTAAHELCHLLLDGHHTLSAVDVLINRVPLDMERRAKAFAGELLLPAKVAGDKWVEAGGPTSVADIREFLKLLRVTYGVTLAVSAWKLDHGAKLRGANLRTQLDIIAPHR